MISSYQEMHEKVESLDFNEIIFFTNLSNIITETRKLDRSMVSSILVRSTKIAWSLLFCSIFFFALV
ncbi:Uncharacterized protein BM_BM13117 [Brugia malayi]|uniref:Bm13117 n=1 Tax=Brugia malayi TaxID=6279 RepID=A0A0J9Y766_BRUMA|nr:Uncharacterized protein BM_BM17367 [Brugia malayi]XP_042932496.1 Uncharacterized protein BM_BM13117 [Brugia malayi]CDQ03759.1 Bm13117 [Brugia malayi]VIO90762.1 Uncharacterized protein BM_BM17367 [Brugia malayi]VIO90772.1 Uncharacterized protein BM_BM13117 [Brugia malayi]